MKNELFKKITATTVLWALLLTAPSCSPLRTGFNPLLATRDVGQSLFIAQHLDSFGLTFLGVGPQQNLLSGTRAFDVFALTLLASILLASPAPKDNEKAAQLTRETQRVYMTFDDNTLGVIDPATRTVITRIPLGQQPSLIAASPAGDFLAITNALSSSVSIVTTADNRLATTIQLEAGSAPYGIAVGADGTRAYVANEAKNSISVLDIPGQRVLTTIAVGTGPSKVAISPDGSLLWAPTSSGTVYVIDTLSNTVSTTFAGIANPVAVAFNKTGTRAYVTSAPANTPGTVVVMDTANYTILTRIPAGTNPYSLTLSPGGTRMYVSNFESNNVTVIDTTTNQVVSTIATGKAPINLAVLP